MRYYSVGDKVKCLIPHSDNNGMIVRRYAPGIIAKVFWDLDKAEVVWSLGITTTVHMSILLSANENDIPRRNNA
jgi:hypothetical protein